MERIFGKLASEGIEVVAITDHNSAASIEEARKLGKKHGIHVFPGVEVSTKEGHATAIFDPGKTAKEIEDWLATMRFVGGKLGDSAALAQNSEEQQLPITKVFASIEREGGVAVAPHPYNDSGFMDVMKKKGAARQDAYHSPHLRALELGGNRERILTLASGGVHGYDKRYACLDTSDAHSVDEIGRRFTHLKMGHMGIGALKQVLYDPAMRIRYSDDWPPPFHAWIESLEVSQGFLDGVEFRFHPDMNCLVGGKAVGKSLLIELLRFALDVPSPIETVGESSQKMLWAPTCLGEEGTVTVHVLAEDEERYRIERTVSDLDEGPEVYYGDTQTRAADSVHEILRAQIYSQNEIIKLGDDLPALLDWLDGFLDLDSENSEIEAKRAEISEVLEQIDEHDAIAEELGELKKRKAQLENKRTLLENKVKEPILKAFTSWEQEKRALKEMQQGLSKLRDHTVGPLEDLDIEDFFPLPEDRTPNSKEIARHREQLLGLESDFVKAAHDLEEAISDKKKGFDAFVSWWLGKFKTAKETYEGVLVSAGVRNASAISSELNKSVQAIENLDRNLKRAQAARQALKELQNRLTRQLVPQYVDCFRRIFKKRLDKATEITKSLDSFVRISVLQMHDRAAFADVVDDMARGSGLRREQRQVIVDNLTPVQLAQMIIEVDAESLAERTDLSESGARAFIDSAWEKTASEDEAYWPSKIYEIMLTELKDAVRVELRVDKDTYKPMDELSGGSKCTAILSVALVQGGCPLIVDQPEDALDNPFVFEQIVKQVRRTKANRQYIFATHNPNVAVASDADLIYCLKATANEGDIDKHGSIDEVSTRDRVVANLEGGPNAFALRSQKYDIEVTDRTAVVLETGFPGSN